MHTDMTNQQEVWLNSLQQDVDEMCNALRTTSKMEKNKEIALEEQLRHKAIEHEEEAKAAALAARQNRQACRELQREISSFASLHKDYVHHLVQHFSGETEKCQQMVWSAIRAVLLSEMGNKKEEKENLTRMKAEERARYDRKRRAQKKDQEAKLEEFSKSMIQVVASAANRTAQWMQEAAAERQQLLLFLQKQAAQEKIRKQQDDAAHQLEKEKLTVEREKELLKTLHLVRKELTCSHNGFKKETKEMAERREKKNGKNKNKEEKEEEARWRRVVEAAEQTSRKCTKAAVEAMRREKRKRVEQQQQQKKNAEQKEEQVKALAKLSEQVRRLEKDNEAAGGRSQADEVCEMKKHHHHHHHGGHRSSRSGSINLSDEENSPFAMSAVLTSGTERSDREKTAKRGGRQKQRKKKKEEEEDEKRKKREKEEMALLGAIKTTQHALDVLRSKQNDGSQKEGIHKSMDRHTAALQEMVRNHTLKMKELRDEVLPRARAELEQLERNRVEVLREGNHSVRMLIEDKQRHIQRMNELVRRMKVAIEGTKEKIMEVEEAEEAALQEQEAHREAVERRLRKRQELRDKESAEIMEKVRYHTKVSSELADQAEQSHLEKQAELLQWQEECGRLQHRLQEVSRKRVMDRTEAQRRLDRLAMETGVCKADLRCNTERLVSHPPANLHREVRKFAASRGMGDELECLDTVLHQMKVESGHQSKKKAEEASAEVRREQQLQEEQQLLRRKMQTMATPVSPPHTHPASPIPSYMSRYIAESPSTSSPLASPYHVAGSPFAVHPPPSPGTQMAHRLKPASSPTSLSTSSPCMGRGGPSSPMKITSLSPLVSSQLLSARSPVNSSALFGSPLRSPYESPRPGYSSNLYNSRNGGGNSNNNTNSYRRSAGGILPLHPLPSPSNGGKKSAYLSSSYASNPAALPPGSGGGVRSRYNDTNKNKQSPQPYHRHRRSSSRSTSRGGSSSSAKKIRHFRRKKHHEKKHAALAL